MNSEFIEHTGPTIDSKDRYNVIDCEKCQYKHLQPIPSSKELDHFYSKLYFDSHKPDYIQTDITDQEFQKISFNDRLKRFEKMTAGRTILDVGCGSGKFLEFAKGRGWNCVGIEPSEMAATHSRSLGLDIYHGTFNDFINDRQEKFDVIQFKNVLEHVPDPNEKLHLALSKLKKDGILYVEVPNDFEPTQEIGIRICRENRSWISIPDHINYFNFNSMQNLLQNKLKLQILMRDTTFPMYLFLWFGLNFIKNRASGKKAHSIRVNFELFCNRLGLNFFRRGLYLLLAALGLGRTVIFYCKKKSELN